MTIFVMEEGVPVLCEKEYVEIAQIKCALVIY
jgi:hypothetical protein